MPVTSTSNQPEYDARTRAELERFGCDDPYDPRFIYRAVFGTGMRGRPQVWPDIQMDVLREVNPDVAGWIHMDGSPLDYPVVKQHLSGRDSDPYLTRGSYPHPSRGGEYEFETSSSATKNVLKNA